MFIKNIDLQKKVKILQINFILFDLKVKVLLPSQIKIRITENIVILEKCIAANLIEKIIGVILRE